MQENTLKNAQGNGRKSHGGTCRELKGDKEGTRREQGTHGERTVLGAIKETSDYGTDKRTGNAQERRRKGTGFPRGRKTNVAEMMIYWWNPQSRSIWLGTGKTREKLPQREHGSIHLTEESLAHEKHKNITKLINAVCPENYLVISFMDYSFHVVNVSSIWCIPGKRKSIQ